MLFVTLHVIGSNNNLGRTPELGAVAAPNLPRLITTMEEEQMAISKCVKTMGFVFCTLTPLLVWGQDIPAGAVRLTPSELQWRPMEVPKGAEITALVGGRSKPGPYVERVKFPPNFTHHSHSHPDDRTYTVISGTWHVGYGDKLDPAKLKALPPGSFHTEPANMSHFIVTKDEGAVIQISGTGPSGTTFVDPAHDPRKK